MVKDMFVTQWGLEGISLFYNFSVDVLPSKFLSFQMHSWFNTQGNLWWIRILLRKRHDTPYNFITRKLGEVLAVLGYSLMQYLIPGFKKIGLEIQELVCLIWCCVCVCVSANCHGSMELLLFIIRSRYWKRKRVDQAKGHEGPCYSCNRKWAI